MEPFNGDAAPLPLGDKARLFAKAVYQQSEQCLMAHSIRAVQAFLEAKGKGRHWISIKIAPTKRFLAKRAIAVITPDQTEIVVAGDITFEEQRLAIAHELSHLLFVKFGPGNFDAVRKEASDNHVTVKQLIESSCQVFEKELCKRHHLFYKNEANRTRLLFPSLEGYPEPKD